MQPVASALDAVALELAERGWLMCTHARACTFFGLPPEAKCSSQRMALLLCKHANALRAPGAPVWSVSAEWIDGAAGKRAGNVYHVSRREGELRAILLNRRALERLDATGARGTTVGAGTGTLCELITTETHAGGVSGVRPHFDIECSLADGINTAYLRAEHAARMLQHILDGVSALFHELYPEVALDPASFRLAPVGEYLAHGIPPAGVCGVLVGDGSRATKFSLHITLCLRDTTGSPVLFENNIVWGAFVRRLHARGINPVARHSSTTTELVSVIDYGIYTHFRVLRMLWALKNTHNKVPLRLVVAGPLCGDGGAHTTLDLMDAQHEWQALLAIFDATMVVVCAERAVVLTCTESDGRIAVSTTKVDIGGVKRRAPSEVVRSPETGSPLQRACQSYDAVVDSALKQRVYAWLRAHVINDTEQPEDGGELFDHARMLSETLLSVCINSRCCRIKPLHAKSDEPHTNSRVFFHINTQTGECRPFCLVPVCRQWVKAGGWRTLPHWTIPADVLYIPPSPTPQAPERVDLRFLLDVAV